MVLQPPAGGTFTFQVSAQGSASSAIDDLVLTVRITPLYHP